MANWNVPSGWMFDLVVRHRGVLVVPLRAELDGAGRQLDVGRGPEVAAQPRRAEQLELDHDLLRIDARVDRNPRGFFRGRRVRVERRRIEQRADRIPDVGERRVERRDVVLPGRHLRQTELAAVVADRLRDRHQLALAGRIHRPQGFDERAGKWGTILVFDDAGEHDLRNHLDVDVVALFVLGERDVGGRRLRRVFAERARGIPGAGRGDDKIRADRKLADGVFAVVAGDRDSVLG